MSAPDHASQTRETTTGLRPTPFDPAMAASFPEWRRDLAWPITPKRLLSAFERSLTGYLELAKAQDDPAQRHLLLAVGGMMAGRLWALQEYALCVQEERKMGLRLTAGAAELDYLRGEAGAELRAPDLPRQMTQIVLPRHPLVRRLLTTHEWTSTWRLPAALLSAPATAVSVNELLVDYAATHRSRLRSREAGSFLVEARRQGAPASRSGQHADLSHRIAEIYAQAAQLEEPYRSRMKALATATIEPYLEYGQHDIDALSRLADMPREIWSGTGSQYPGRVLGLEVMARGGKVMRFDHGGTTGMVSFKALFELAEFGATTHFVAATPKLAEVMRASYDIKAQVVGHTGFPSIRKIRLNKRRSGPRRKVMYLSSTSLSHRKNATSTISELVYADWSHRLTALLAGLPIDLTIKPHPMSVPAHGRHPLEDLAEVSYRPFEEIMGEADVYVYDGLNSTTFWEAMCTDRLVVFLDLGYVGRNAALETRFRQRCRVVDVHYDERNLPQVDGAELEAAVVGGADREDPSAYRQLFLAE